METATGMAMAMAMGTEIGDGVDAGETCGDGTARQLPRVASNATTATTTTRTSDCVDACSPIAAMDTCRRASKSVTMPTLPRPTHASQ